jgi:hypothetical protein
MVSRYQSNITVPWFIVANPAPLCHKRGFIARLIKGCRGRWPCWLFRFGNNQAFSTL